MLEEMRELLCKAATIPISRASMLSPGWGRTLQKVFYTLALLLLSKGGLGMENQQSCPVGQPSF